MEPAPLTLLYDGRCSLCVRTADALRRLDRGRGRLRLVDFRADFAPAEAAGISPDALEGAMHGIHVDGRVVAGPDAVRDGLRAVGLGPVSRMLAWPVVGPLFGRLYDVVARNRLKWFEQKSAAGSPGCDNGTCRIDHRA